MLGNEEIRIGLVLNWVIGKNGTIIRGESGSAKTVMMKAAVSLVWGDEALDGDAERLYVMMPGSKKKAFTREMESKIQNATHCYIPEWQNVIDYEWILKLWLEGRKAEYDRAKYGGQDYETFDLPPLPVMTSLAEANEILPDLSNEMKRRMVSFYTRSDEALNNDVHEMKALHRMLPDEELVTLSSEDFTALRAVIMGAMAEERRVINPCADRARKAVPTKYTSSNTFIEYWFDMIEGVTKFYRHERPSTRRYLFATPGDNYVAFLLVGGVIRDLALGIPPLGNHILDYLPVSQVFGSLQSDTRHEAKHIDEIVDYLDEKMGMPRSKKVIEGTMDKLVAAGFAKQDEQKLYYTTRDVHHTPCEIDWALLVESGVDWVKQKYPTVAEEYEAMAREYIDPFTGEEKVLETSTPEKGKKQKIGGLSNVSD